MCEGFEIARLTPLCLWSGGFTFVSRTRTNRTAMNIEHPCCSRRCSCWRYMAGCLLLKGFELLQPVRSLGEAKLLDPNTGRRTNAPPSPGPETRCGWSRCCVARVGDGELFSWAMWTCERRCALALESIDGGIWILGGKLENERHRRQVRRDRRTAGARRGKSRHAEEPHHPGPREPRLHLAVDLRLQPVALRLSLQRSSTQRDIGRRPP